MLVRRIETFERRGAARLRRRAARGHELAHTLPEGMVVGDQNLTHTFWVTPIRVRNRAAVVTALRAADFDATEVSSLIVVSSDHKMPAGGIPSAAWLKEIVFLPSGDDIPESEWQRQVEILEQVAEPIETPAGRELAELSGVSSTP
jgi:hypothetical protein